METWVYLPLAFGSGFIFGSVVYFLHFRSRLRFYKRFIESRLESLCIPTNLRHPSASNGGMRRMA
jgi:hypothetical protein